MKNYKYKFSIIMSIYNVENYLEEAIESIINQDIGFKKNVQLILINDGSPDNSEDICLKYKRLYPDNIIYKKKKNGGLASAKNVGLKYIEGRYVNFFDSDDTLPLNTLREVYNYFKRNAICIDFVSLPLVFFEAEEGLHLKYRYMGTKNRIIDLREEPYNFVISSASCFYKKEIFDTFNFDETYVGEEDTLLNGTIYLNNPRFGYVCERGVQYNYRKRLIQNSIVNTAKFNPKSYETIVSLLSSIIPPNKPIKHYQQELIIYELRSRLQTINPKLFDTTDTYNKIVNEYVKFIKLLDKEYILYLSKYCNTVPLKKLFLKLGQFDDEEFNDYLLNNTNVTIQRYDIDDNKLFIDISYSNFGQESLDLCIFRNGIIIDPTEKIDFKSPLDESIGNFILDDTHLRKYVFDIKNNTEIRFILYDSKTNAYYPMKKIKMARHVCLNSFNNCQYYKQFKILFKNRRISIKRIKNTKLSFLKKNLITTIKILKEEKVYAFSRLFAKVDKKFILISDRLDKAGDNGEALFKYINHNDPKLAKKTYYVIDSKCDDYKRMKKYGKVVKHGSLKHKRLFLNASHIYTSHTMPVWYNAYDTKKLSYYRDLFNYKFIWLQHGITQNDISTAANRYIKGIDYVITCTNDEYKEFNKLKYCFNKEQIVLTGFARYDYLKNDVKNIITLAPTWRRGYGNYEGKREDFVYTNYYKEYSKILLNKQLIDILRKNKLILNFVLHPEMLNYVEDFLKYENDVIRITRPEDINYSKIFSDSKLLITDYSSIFFDFAYLNKPEVYFQFDKDTFYGGHYDKGYFEFEKDAFGDVIYSSTDVVNKIIYYIDNNFEVEKKYRDRINKTFKYHDKNNSKRILDLTYYKK